jgi:hypothetical protein
MAESLHAFPLRMEIDGVPVMPVLRALAERSLSFERFYNQAWLGKTADGEFASLQSLHPLSEAPISSSYLMNSWRALPAVLAEHGYDTFSAHAYLGSLYHMRDMPALGRDFTHGGDGLVVLRNGSFIAGDVACDTPNASAATASCADVVTGATLDPAALAGSFAAAREQLDVSDLIVRNDLIRKLTEPRDALRTAGAD